MITVYFFQKNSVVVFFNVTWSVARNWLIEATYCRRTLGLKFTT